MTVASVPTRDRKPRLCPLCGAAQRSVLNRRDDWEIVQCQRCEMVFIGSELSYDVQVQDHDWPDDFYKEVDRRKQNHPVLMFFSRLTRPLRPRTNERLLTQALRWRKGGRLVDFGCGDGSFLRHAVRNFDVTGLELSPAWANVARQRIGADKIFEGPLTEIAAGVLKPESFDIVTQFGYLEHEWRPLEGLRAAFRALKPGGVTLIKSPNYASWNRTIMGMDWCGYHIPAHCNYFTPRTLSRMLRETGFEPLRRPFSYCFPTSDSLWMAARKPF